MAIDPTNPLLNGPRRVDATRTVAKDYKALYERVLKRQAELEQQIRELEEQLLLRKPAGFGRGAKPSLEPLNRPAAAPQRSDAPKGRLTAADIERGKSPKGGWTRETLAGWGVPWPPPKGWKDDLLKAK